MKMRKKVLVIFGTRPEAIKMAPVIKELEKHNREIQTVVALTAQHREMLDQVVDAFRFNVDYDLDIMTENQSLSAITTKILTKLSDLFSKEKYDFILTQGDTTTTMASSLAGFYHCIPVGHVEAGLRTYDKMNPFPEEINRQITSRLADIHFAPTENARRNLIGEGIKEDQIIVTGNTVIDALVKTIEDNDYNAAWSEESVKKILVTAHRRENWGGPLREICQALKEIANQNKNVKIVFPVHLNPNVRKIVHESLSGIENIELINPVDYRNFIKLMAESYIILSDSGGIQEEAPSLGKPVLVLRQETERVEAIEAGTCKLVGTDKKVIVEEVDSLLSDRDKYTNISKRKNPYGDGRASQRIVEYLLGYFKKKDLGE